MELPKLVEMEHEFHLTQEGGAFSLRGSVLGPEESRLSVLYPLHMGLGLQIVFELFHLNYYRQLNSTE